ncbi:MAG: DUF4148 domain-containing protein [Polaromonas sp.]|nr:DUF4148 domain-containing protein [Polaromonas sp.]
MNKSSLLIAVAAFAALASTGVRAESPALSSQFAIQIEGNRTRAEVMSEAVAAVKNYNHVPLAARVIAPMKSDVTTAAVRDQAAQALRLGQIPSGELSL